VATTVDVKIQRPRQVVKGKRKKFFGSFIVQTLRADATSWASGCPCPGMKPVDALDVKYPRTAIYLLISIKEPFFYREQKIT
jgi:hypothetical protein